MPSIKKVIFQYVVSLRIYKGGYVPTWDVKKVLIRQGLMLEGWGGLIPVVLLLGRLLPSIVQLPSRPTKDLCPPPTVEETEPPTTPPTTTTPAPLIGCGEGQWQCKSGQCIEASLRCDRKYHCQDGTDEYDCGKS